MKVLITGSSGSLGRMMVNYLIARKIHVTGIDIRESPERFPEEYFRFYNCSVTEKEKLIEVFSEENPTNVIHFAAAFNKIRDRRLEYEIDIGGSTNVLKASDNTPSVKQLIFSSSAAAYGGNRDNKVWLRETEPLRPGKYTYGIDKKIIERIYSETPLRSDLHIALLRICTVVGPSYDKPRSVVSILIRFPYLPEFCKDNRIQFLHSDDMTSLFGLIMEDKDINGIFNLAPDSYAIIRELVPGKKFLKVPLLLITGLVWILWNLKILNLQPAATKNAVYPIIIDPAEITSRYSYVFNYSSKEAFDSTVTNNKIPADAGF